MVPYIHAGKVLTYIKYIYIKSTQEKNKNRVGVQTRKGGRKSSGFSQGEEGGLWIECDHKMLNSWLLTEYSTQVVNYTKMTL